MKRMRLPSCLLFLAIIAGLIVVLGGGGSIPEVQHGEQSMSAQNGSATQTATLGGGCFWCIEAVYERIEGVQAVVSGYAGGTMVDPTYEQVCSGKTGHAEVVQVHFDPEVTSYSEILDLFWKAHDPTTPNRQGADIGTQYRSIILYDGEEQARIAEQSKVEASALFDDPIVTEIKALELFYEAEGYHQDYYANNPAAGYCSFVIRPKLQKLGLDS